MFVSDMRDQFHSESRNLRIYNIFGLYKIENSFVRIGQLFVRKAQETKETCLKKCLFIISLKYSLHKLLDLFHVLAKFEYL